MNRLNDGSEYREPATVLVNEIRSEIDRVSAHRARHLETANSITSDKEINGKVYGSFIRRNDYFPCDSLRHGNITRGDGQEGCFAPSHQTHFAADEGCGTGGDGQFATDGQPHAASGDLRC